MSFAHYIAPNGASPLVKQESYVPYNRSLVYGIGLNDFPTPTCVNDKDIRSYTIWRVMLQRCYSELYREGRPTYTGCTVAEEWHSFTAFEKWFTANHTEGCQLDKDILFPGNKVYSAETCVFVSPALNALLLDHGAARGKYPLGVSLDNRRPRYQARVSTEAGRKCLGLFDTPLAAHQAWQLAKADIIANFPTTDPRIQAALDKRVAQLRDDYANNRITVKL